MKRFIPFCLICAILFSCTSSDKYSKLKEERISNLLENKSYFKMDSYFKLNKEYLNEKNIKYYEAFLANAFIKPQKSNYLLNDMLKDNLCDSVKCKLYQLKLLNHVNLFEYAEAAHCSDLIINKYSEWIDSTELIDYKNEIKIWESLKEVPRQEINRKGDCTISITKDKVGLSNMSINLLNGEEDFIFDTGANFSTITKSLALKYKLRIIDTDFFVTASTGGKVNSNLAIADSLYVGNILLKNVVFLVFDDKYLSFPQADYYINGIIGFPVISALEEIQFIGSDKLFVPEVPNTYKLNNFALDGLTPSIAVNYKKDTLRFHFDTGASNTNLYQKFYSKYKEFIEENYTMQQFKVGGVGGMKSFDGYKIDEISFEIGGKKATIKDIQLHKDKIGGLSDYFHGNLGQDFVKQFKKTIISFKYNSIVFER